VANSLYAAPVAAPISIPGSVAVLQFRPLVRSLEQFGIEPARVFGRVGIDEPQLFDENARVAAGAEFAIWDAIEEISGDPLIALKLADSIAPGAMGAFEMATGLQVHFAHRCAVS